jgi:phosphatidylserine decarboxylase
MSLKLMLQWWTKMTNKLFPIYYSGLKYIYSAFGVFILCMIFDLDLLSFIASLAMVFFIFVFRNPEREVPAFEEGSVVAPVDGIVVAIQEIEDEKYAYRVEVEASCLDVGVLRAPIDAQVSAIELNHGARLSSATPLYKELNENIFVAFDAPNGNSVGVQHYLKQTLFPLVVDIMQDQKVKQASRYGYIAHANSFIYLPQNFRISVNVGNELKGSETLLGYFS